MRDYRTWLAVFVAVAVGFLAGRFWPGPSDLSGRYGVIYEQTREMSDDEREEVVIALRRDWAKQREFEQVIRKYSDDVKNK